MYGQSEVLDIILFSPPRQCRSDVLAKPESATMAGFTDRSPWHRAEQRMTWVRHDQILQKGFGWIVVRLVYVSEHQLWNTRHKRLDVHRSRKASDKEMSGRWFQLP
jgi:hypothetical protein